MSVSSVLKRCVPVLLLFGLLMPPTAIPGVAQVRSGATLTVLRGTVGVVHADGSPVSPAPSGMTLGAGDRVATVAASGAIVTFFEGSEVELGSDTSIVIRSASGEGARSNITIESVVGSTVHKVVTLTDPGSSYRVESGGTVGLVRGTLFAHRRDPNGDVTLALAGCGQAPARSSETCLDFPREGLPMRPGDVRTASARGDIVTGSFAVEAPLFNVVSEPVEPGDSPSGTDNPGIRTGSRAAPQGQAQQPSDSDRDPDPPVAPAIVAGQAVLTAPALAGSRALQVSSQLGFAINDIVTIGAPGNQEVGQIVGFGSILLLNPTGRDHQVGEPVVKTGTVAGAATATGTSQPVTPTATPTITPTSTQTVAPTPTGTVVPCNNATNSGGEGVTTTVHELGRASGPFNFFRDAFSVPDRFEILYQGNVVLDTGSVSGSQTHVVNFGPGTSTNITVRVTGPSGTAWTYTVSCPT